MACEGHPERARLLFEEAWDTRRDDYDAAVAAHYLARHQPTPVLALDWNARAVSHAERVTDGRATELLPSLYLNLGDSLLAVGRPAEARACADLADELAGVAGGWLRIVCRLWHRPVAGKARRNRTANLSQA